MWQKNYIKNLLYFERPINAKKSFYHSIGSKKLQKICSIIFFSQMYFSVNGVNPYEVARENPVFLYRQFRFEELQAMALDRCSVLKPVLNRTGTTLLNTTTAAMKGYLNIAPNVNPGLYPLPLSIIASVILDYSLSRTDSIFTQWQNQMTAAEQTQVQNLLQASNTINNNGVSIEFLYKGTGTNKTIVGLSDVYFNGVKATKNNTFMLPKGTIPNLANPYDQLSIGNNLESIFAQGKSTGLVKNNTWLANIEAFAILDPSAVNFLRSYREYKVSMPRAGAASFLATPLYVPSQFIYSSGQSVDPNNVSGSIVSDGFWADLFFALRGEGYYQIAFPYAGIQIFDSLGVRKIPSQLTQTFSLPNGKIKLSFCDLPTEMDALRIAGQDIGSLYDDAVLIIKNGQRYVQLVGKMYLLDANDTLEITDNLSITNPIFDYFHRCAVRFDGTGLYTVSNIATPTTPIPTPTSIPTQTLCIKDNNTNTAVNLKLSTGVVNVNLKFKDEYSFVMRQGDIIQGSKVTLGQDLSVPASFLEAKQQNTTLSLTGNVIIAAGSVLLLDDSC